MAAIEFAVLLIYIVEPENMSIKAISIRLYAFLNTFAVVGPILSVPAVLVNVISPPQLALPFEFTVIVFCPIMYTVPCIEPELLTVTVVPAAQVLFTLIAAPDEFCAIVPLLFITIAVAAEVKLMVAPSPSVPL